MNKPLNSTSVSLYSKWKNSKTGYLMLIPAFLLIAGVMFYPISYSVRMSLSDVDITPNGYDFSFVGLQNYLEIFSSNVYWGSVWFTFYFTFVTVLLEVIIGMLIALAINKVKGMMNVSLVVMLIPWSFITVVSAQMWSYIYNGVYGVMNYIFEMLHLIDSPITWLGTPAMAVISMMIAEIWKTTPFVVIILLAGLQMVPKDQYEAADIDGANRWQRFYKITMPAIKGSIAVAVLFRVLQAFGVFDLPFVLTGGGPGNTTQPLAMLGHKVLFQNLNFGIGAAISVSTVLFILALATIFFSVIRSVIKGDD
ncbi:carbohydrate ABC transporter permease [Lederbergia ruris]|uniref:carbohydrate ABC transporter permease n=1 Tax=Lederbergia ruris TaxID=217495 RepID=UPI0039A1BDFD